MPRRQARRTIPLEYCKSSNDDQENEESNDSQSDENGENSSQSNENRMKKGSKSRQGSERSNGSGKSKWKSGRNGSSHFDNENESGHNSSTEIDSATECDENDNANGDNNENENKNDNNFSKYDNSVNRQRGRRSRQGGQKIFEKYEDKVRDAQLADKLGLGFEPIGEHNGHVRLKVGGTVSVKPSTSKGKWFTGWVDSINYINVGNVEYMTRREKQSIRPSQMEATIKYKTMDKDGKFKVETVTLKLSSQRIRVWSRDNYRAQKYNN